MDIKKTLGDILFVLIVIVFALTIFGSRRPGPVEQAARLSGGQQAGHTHTGANGTDQSGQQMQHSLARPEISNGEPVIRLGEATIGRDWFDDSVQYQASQLAGGEMDSESARKMGEFITLEEGLATLISGALKTEYRIVADQDDVTERMDSFYANFSSREEAETSAAQMGMSMEQLRSLWEEDSTERQLQGLYSNASGIPEDSETFEDSYYSWLMDRVFEADWEFVSPEFETKYDEFKEAISLIMSGEMGVGEVVGGSTSAADTENSVH